MTKNYEPNDLTLELASRWETWGNEGLPCEFERRLRNVGTFSDQALALLVELAGELETRLASRMPLVAVNHFVAQADGFISYADRMAVIRCLEYLDEPRLLPASWCGRTPPDVNMRRRPLTEIEMGLVRFISLTSSKRSGPVGAFDAGMASGELGILLPRGVLADAHGHAAHLDGPGTLRAVTSGYPATAPRLMDLPPWVQKTFNEMLVNADPTRPILYGGNEVAADKIQSSILMNVSKVLTVAGLGNDKTVAPLSIRNAAARRAYETGGLEAAATLLGSQRYDSVAREIGLKLHVPARKSRVHA